MNLDLDALEKFIKGMSRSLDNLCEEQIAINVSYGRVKEEWSDKLLTIVGQGLHSTQAIIIKMYYDLIERIKQVDTHAEDMACYLETDWDNCNISVDNIANLRVEEVMNKRVIRGTTSEGIRSFEIALEKYIENTRDIARSIKNLHDEVGVSWKDSQYDKISESIDEFQLKIKTNLDKLDVLHSYVQQKRKFLEDKGE